MIKRISIIVALLLSMTAFAHPQKCRLDLRPAGIYYNQCPRTMVAQGTDVWITGGPHPMVTVRALCATTEIVCTEVEKDLPEEKN